MNAIISYKEALEKSEAGKRHLLLGNGFSIDCFPDIFNYPSLLAKADFKTAPAAREVFNSFNTSDFERVVCALRDFALIAHLYGADSSQAALDADATREVLIKTIQNTHPAVPLQITEQEYSTCWKFLANFETVFTLNYDLLLYWAQMKRLAAGQSMDFTDGFGRSSGVLEWAPTRYRSKKVYFLHGALHLCEFEGEVRKYVWKEGEPSILDQVASEIRKDRFPLFVCEGKSEEKLAVIKLSSYLRYAYSELRRLGGDLFIFGHSLREEDNHIFKQISESKVSKLFVGIRLADGMDLVADLQGRAFTLAKKCGIENLFFFDVQTTHVWR